MDTSDKRLLVIPRMSKEKCKFAGIKISIMEGIMIFLMELLTVIAYFLALLSPFIFIAWLFIDWRNHKQREKRWNEAMKKRFDEIQQRRQ